MSGVRKEGRVIRIVKRELQNLVGEVVFTESGKAYLDLDDDKKDLVIELTSDSVLNCVEGHKVLVEVVKEVNKHKYLSIPLMVKENSIVILGSHDDKPDYDYEDNCEIRIYELQDGACASSVVYGMDNTVKTKVEARRNGNVITVNVETNCKCTVKAINISDEEFVVEGNKTLTINA